MSDAPLGTDALAKAARCCCARRTGGGSCVPATPAPAEPRSATTTSPSWERLRESARFMGPSKTSEFLTAGLPVVSTPVLDVVHDYDEASWWR